MGAYTLSEWLALWPAGLLHGLTSPWTWAAVLLAAVMVAATERFGAARPARRRKDRSR